MMSVSIFINGKPIYTRTVVRIGRSKTVPSECIYELDTGKKLRHNPNHGAVPLAMKMLQTINEVKTIRE